MGSAGARCPTHTSQIVPAYVNAASFELFGDINGRIMNEKINKGHCGKARQSKHPTVGLCSTEYADGKTTVIYALIIPRQVSELCCKYTTYWLEEDANTL